MAHQFHDDTRRRAVERQEHLKGHPQGVEVHALSGPVHRRNLRGVEVETKSFHPRNEPGENALFRLERFRANLPQFVRQLPVNLQLSGLMVLRGGATHAQMRLFPVKVHVLPFELLQFPAAQAGFHRRGIRSASRTGHSE
ncbi:MAG: hypothetical protein P4L99_06825 [Chthoniobacter sp.]|nr:hypothetical protein [Chthoniobacter sp.]